MLSQAPDPPLQAARPPPAPAGRPLPAEVGTSERTRPWGFVPAFRDGATGRVYRSRWADGRPAPCHFSGGLPPALLERGADGRPAPRPGVVAGFLKGGRFFDRAEAARYVAARAGAE